LRRSAPFALFRAATKLPETWGVVAGLLRRGCGGAAGAGPGPKIVCCVSRQTSSEGRWFKRKRSPHEELGQRHSGAAHYFRHGEPSPRACGRNLEVRQGYIHRAPPPPTGLAFDFISCLPRRPASARHTSTLVGGRRRASRNLQTISRRGRVTRTARRARPPRPGAGRQISRTKVLQIPPLAHRRSERRGALIHRSEIHGCDRGRNGPARFVFMCRAVMRAPKAAALGLGRARKRRATSFKHLLVPHGNQSPISARRGANSPLSIGFLSARKRRGGKRLRAGASRSAPLGSYWRS